MDQENYQSLLFPFAYNILGSSEDAKDAIQDVLIKYLPIEKENIKNEKGFLIKSTINHSINLKNKKSKITRDNVWLPEPVSTEDTTRDIDRDTVLSYSLLVLLEKLTAKERAIFILRESFDYSHKEIAETIGFTIENSRKLLSRAKGKLKGHKDQKAARQKHPSPILEKYIQFIKNGDVGNLEALLSEDISLAADGGEHIKVVRDLTTGITASSKLLVYVYKAYLHGLEFKIRLVNHQPAILFYQNNTLYNCQVFELNEGKIHRIYSIVDPEKLKY